jgi:hypothetical protein
MTRTSALAVSLALFLSACIPAIPFPQLTTATPEVIDSPATTAAQTIAAVVTFTESPSATETATAGATAESTATLSETMIVQTRDSETLTAIGATQKAPETEAGDSLSATTTPPATEPNFNAMHHNRWKQHYSRISGRGAYSCFSSGWQVFLCSVGRRTANLRYIWTGSPGRDFDHNLQRQSHHKEIKLIKWSMPLGKETILDSYRDHRPNIGGVWTRT